MKYINHVGTSIIEVLNEKGQILLEVSSIQFKTLKELKQYNYLDKFKHTITDNQYNYLKNIKG